MTLKRGSLGGLGMTVATFKGVVVSRAWSRGRGEESRHQGRLRAGECLKGA
jgi:hypothetical protein